MQPSRRTVLARGGRVGLVVATLVVAGLGAAGPAHSGAISGSYWRPIGPQPSWGFFSGGESGRATSVAVNPFNADDVWLGTAGGGVWHSTDAGLHFVPTSGNQAALPIGAIALSGCAPSGCTTIYAGTGENAIRRDTLYGQGLLIGSIRSNGSVQWSLAKGLPTYDFSLASINDVVLDPTTSGTGQILFVTLSSGVTASAADATVTAPEPKLGGYGIYKSGDNGVTWTKLSVAGTSPGERPTDLKMDRANHQILYAGFLGRGLFKSTNSGTDWCPLNPGIPRPNGCPNSVGLPPAVPIAAGDLPFDHVEVDLFRQNTDILYVTFGYCPDHVLQSCKPSVYKSTDAGLTWQPMFGQDSAPAPECYDHDSYSCPEVFSRYTHGLTIHPSQSGKIFLAGNHLCVSTGSGAEGSWTCADRNTKFVSSPDWEYTHLDHRAVVFADSNPSRVYDAGDGGIAVSDDGGATWTPRNDTLQTFEFQSIAWSPATALLFGGAQDNSSLLWQGANKWRNSRCCGDGGFSVIDSVDPTLVYTTTNDGPIDNIDMIPLRSDDGGLKFKPAVDPIYPFARLYNFGLSTTDPRAFYPPLVQDVNRALYFGTNRLWRSLNGMQNWIPLSPVLSTADAPEIWRRKDVITAIAVAPSDPTRIYLGYYSGKVFATDGACASPSCWFEMDFRLPGDPITSIAVSPVDKENVYVTTGGFRPGVHVWGKTRLTIGWFQTGSITELNGVPANWIAIERDDRFRMWLGTDKGVYKSLNGGGSWFWFGGGMPNVPVYMIAIDPDRDRVVAATHGRGAYLLSQPWLQDVKGCGYNALYDVGAHGLGFSPNQSCFMSVMQQSWNVCASGSIDAVGGSVSTDANGMLVSSKPIYQDGLPFVYLCKKGSCLGTPMSACDQQGDPLSTIRIQCGPQVVYKQITGCAPLATLTSSWMTLALPEPAPFTPDPDATSGPGRSPSADGRTRWNPDPSLSSGGGSFDLLPTVQSGDGSTRALCSVSVPYTGTETETTVLERARDAVNADGACLSAGVGAEVIQAALERESEDIMPLPPSLGLLTAGVTGRQLVPAVRAAPGASPGVCFSLQGLGVPVEGDHRIVRARFPTGLSGAQGGQVRVKESSPQGDCSITLPTTSGETGASIAAAFVAAFQAPDPAAPSAECPSGANPHDLELHGDSIVSVEAIDLTVCIGDPGLGVTVAPLEVCTGNADCDDQNPCTADTCDVTTGRCQNAPAPDGVPCDDGDPCTAGGACVAGACGTPVACNDGDPCSTDRCDRATGACLSTPVACDDGNPCTLDSCTAASGHCISTPVAGLPCDDGNLCTIGDTCVQAPGGGAPSCQGSPACADPNPCTSDLCDPTTGQCLNAPIQCDDGNPCTFDICQTDGTCVSSPIAGGGTCDDGDRCTTGDLCVTAPGGDPVCQGQTTNCDDGNACTLDQCDAVTGGCHNSATPIAEAAGLQFTSGAVMTWSQAPGAFFYNTYRGTIPAHMLGSRPPPVGIYDQTCFEQADSHGDGGLIATDPVVPPLGTGFYYEVSEATACGEGPIGSDSNGTVIPNTSACSGP